MDGAVHLQRLHDAIGRSAASGVRATPTFLVNGTLQDVSYGLRPLYERVRHALNG
jgi:hypothetical protein